MSYLPLYASLVDHCIDVVCRHPRLQRARGNIQDLTRESANPAHALLLLLVQNLDAALAKDALLGDWNAVASVIRVGDGTGDGTVWR